MTKSRMPKKFKIVIIVLFLANVVPGIALGVFLASDTAKSMFDNILESISYRKSAPRRERFERLLEERYGEEFVCFETQNQHTIAFNRPTYYEGLCAPKNDMSLVFEAGISIKNENLIYDRYPAAIVGRQLSEELSNDLDGVFGRRDIICKMGSSGDNDEVIQRAKDGTLDWEFYYVKNPYLYGDVNYSNYAAFYVLVDSSELRGSYEEEWDAFEAAKKKIVDTIAKNGIELSVQIRLFFSPPDMYDKCLELLSSYEEDALGKLWEYLEDDYVHEVGARKYHRTMELYRYTRDEYIEKRADINY